MNTNGSGSGDAAGGTQYMDAVALAGEVRGLLLLLLADGRPELTPAEARWCEHAQRVLAARLERAEHLPVRLCADMARAVHAIMLAILSDFGVSATDPRVAEIASRRIQEYLDGPGETGGCGGLSSRRGPDAARPRVRAGQRAGRGHAYPR